ncbi:MAG: hypothetical protein JWN04_3428 [Myxococcaceae bacterium]|nr:hypothetical protein [Myxococcaceae bacterium]
MARISSAGNVVLRRDEYLRLLAEVDRLRMQMQRDVDQHDSHRSSRVLTSRADCAPIQIGAAE